MHVPLLCAIDISLCVCVHLDRPIYMYDLGYVSILVRFVSYIMVLRFVFVRGVLRSFKLLILTAGRLPKHDN